MCGIDLQVFICLSVCLSVNANLSSPSSKLYYIEIATSDIDIRYTYIGDPPYVEVKFHFELSVHSIIINVSRVLMSSGNHGKSGKNVPCMQKSWNLIKTLNNHGKIMEFCEII